MNKKILIPLFFVLILSASVLAFSLLEWYKNANNWVTGKASFNPTGNLYVASNPTSANLYVDNVFKGTTPGTVLGLRVGNHAVKITKSGYLNYSTLVRVYVGKTTSLSVVLTPILPPIQNQTICTDTDGGKNYSVKGTTVWGPFDGKYYNATDECDYVGKILSERYCYYSENLGDYYSEVDHYKCPNICKDGACVSGCPPDMLQINDYCIDKDLNPPANWFEQVMVCGDEGKRLCGVFEWTYACQKNFQGINDEVGKTAEFVDDRRSQAAPGCNLNSLGDTASLKYTRCCKQSSS